jgi:hypothetical protein
MMMVNLPSETAQEGLKSIRLLKWLISPHKGMNKEGEFREKKKRC